MGNVWNSAKWSWECYNLAGNENHNQISKANLANTFTRII